MPDPESPLTVGVVKETKPGERRVALVPTLVGRLARRGLRVVIESGAGEGARLADEVFEEAGAEIGDAWAADIVLTVSPPSVADIGKLGESAVLAGFLAPLTNTEELAAMKKAGIRAFAVESIPRISRAQAMDALSSQAGVAGYRAVLLAAQRLPKFFPMLTTAAGTVPPAKVLVLGAGVAGLQALATAKRLGAQATGYDVRPEVAEQVRSVGASWLDLGIEAVGEGGYARELTEAEREEQQRRLTEATTGFDVVITTALVPGRTAPTLVTAEAVRGMRAGSVIVDMAGETGGNCELTEPGKEIVAHDVTICSPLNLPAEMPVHASELYGRNLTELLELLVNAEGELVLDFSDPIVSGACVAGADEEVR
ncbi:NAD(P) transhydrogenase subunit alpha [Prauserella marina]|uniref:NAD(P) transhydrogenase subunit alpha part 1 n=1 Tax=Prauserella marina TaxID=530584 RepID=A0A222VLN7_9PSEU|nr:Re/Si-specific NAD(P)(+) transhydrogenase subunit alpha [Prauserella marina]ASR34804.1 NAD(P) transhydrogenase subunit alpha [Prauserella marina]PWV85504.1 NAD(P) transhydrogenase alpha subunit [Prauserella marina]SDC53264.1 NAD(P) transhydrogenase subunit alpha [Prauserella marina]